MNALSMYGMNFGVTSGYTHFVEKGRFYPFLKVLLEQEKMSIDFNREYWSEEELKMIHGGFCKCFLRSLIPPLYINRLWKLLGKEPL